ARRSRLPLRRVRRRRRHGVPVPQVRGALGRGRRARVPPRAAALASDRGPSARGDLGPPRARAPARVTLEQDPERGLGRAAALDETDRVVEIDVLAEREVERGVDGEPGALESVDAPLQHQRLALVVDLLGDLLEQRFHGWRYWPFGAF